MSTFAEIKALVRKNLDDANITFYSNDDLVDSFQDGYNDIAAKARCIVKKYTQDWQQDLVYYDMIALGLTDYMGATAIFNNNANRFLDDNISLRQLDNSDDKWELRKGTPNCWIPVNNKFFAMYPVYGTAFGNFDLYYWAKAPTIVDTDTPLIATDMQRLLEIYSTADLIEQGEEYAKAQILWEEYFSGLESYRERCENMAKSDLLLRA